MRSPHLAKGWAKVGPVGDLALQVTFGNEHIAPPDSSERHPGRYGGSDGALRPKRTSEEARMPAIAAPNRLGLSQTPVQQRIAGTKAEHPQYHRTNESGPTGPRGTRSAKTMIKKRAALSPKRSPARQKGGSSRLFTRIATVLAPPIMASTQKARAERHLTVRGS